MPGATENRVWQKSFETLETRQAEPLQTLGGHQENEGAGYDYAVDSLLAAEDATQIGYHATDPANVDSILNGGLNNSAAGRLGGEGVYVNDTQEGAIAEYMARNPNGRAPSVLQVEYNPGLNYTISPPPVGYTTGPLPFAADTLTTESVRLPGTFNTIIRNGSATVVP
jgi:hypothetical protein